MYRPYIKKCIFLTLYYESTSSSSKLSMQKYFIGIPGPILEVLLESLLESNTMKDLSFKLGKWYAAMHTEMKASTSTNRRSN